MTYSLVLREALRHQLLSNALSASTVCLRRCLLSLLALVCVGVVVLIALKMAGVVGKNVKVPTITVKMLLVPAL